MAPLLKTEVGLVKMLRSRIETHQTLNDVRRLYGTENGKTQKNLETTVAGAVQWSFVFLPLLCVACERTKTFCFCTCVSVRAAMGNWGDCAERGNLVSEVMRRSNSNTDYR
jgi:hypothetical protein